MHSLLLGLSNVVGDNGSAGFNRRTRRRGKHEKILNKVVEGKYQSLPFGQLESSDRLHGEASCDGSLITISFIVSSLFLACTNISL